MSVQFFGLVVICILVWRLIDIGWRGWMGLRVVLGAKRRKSIDVSAWKLQPPARAGANIAALNALGFTRLGETQVQLPGGKAPTVWVLVDPGCTIQAEVAFGMVSFTSYFREDILVVTDYPSGEHIEQARYQSHTMTRGIPEAYQHHQRQVEKFRSRYGEAHALQGMADYLRWETVGRTLYGSVKLRRFQRIHLVGVGAFAAGVLVTLAVSLVFRAIDPPATVAAVIAQQEIIELVIIGLLLPVAILPGLFQRRMRADTHRDSPG
jgi:hypothetical protein